MPDVIGSDRLAHQRCRQGGKLALVALSALVALATGAVSARAQVSIRGDRASVEIEAANAPISDILSALETAFRIRYRTSVPLDQAISTTYRGPLRRVVSDLLDGFNYYVADTADGRMEITVLGRTGAAAVPGNLPSAGVAAAQATAASPPLRVPPPTAAEVAAERQKAHHRRPPP